jgi:hypothetical protein
MSNDRLSEDPHLSAFFLTTTKKALFHKGAHEAGKLGKGVGRVKYSRNRKPSSLLEVSKDWKEFGFGGGHGDMPPI